MKINHLSMMKRLQKITDESLELPDEDFFYDRLSFMKLNYENEEELYKSDKKEDMIRVLEYGLETINVLIQQVLRFQRIVYETKNGVVYNFPKNKKPEFYLKDIFSKTKLNTIKERRRK